MSESTSPFFAALAKLGIAPSANTESNVRAERDADYVRRAATEHEFADARRAIQSIPMTALVRSLVLENKTQQTAAQRVVNSWLANQSRKRFIVLLGGVGVGKTVAAAVAAKFFGRCVYISAPQLRPIATKELWGDERNSRVIQAPFVVLDDLGTEADDEDKFHAALFELVNGRLDVGHTVITSNLSRKEFARRYGERVIDRLRESAEVHEIAGKSMRAP